jgi:glycosyltransferase involved in cell wall biosynthesis
MNLLLDASNIKIGGGITHLNQIVSSSFFNGSFKNISLLADTKTLHLFNKNINIHKLCLPKWAENPIIKQLYLKFFFQRHVEKYDVVFSLGSSILNHPKLISFCQNLIPFEVSEYKRFNLLSYNRWRILFLQKTQLACFKASKIVIFLSNYSIQILSAYDDNLVSKAKLLPHGVDFTLFNRKKKVECLEERNTVFNLLYVSSLDLYKHQDILAKAVHNLNSIGHNIHLTFIGPNLNNSIREKILTFSHKDPLKRIQYLETLNQEELVNYYHQSDAFIFASSCESFGMPVLEAMACGLPVLCSDRSSMKEIAKDSALYFDPENVQDIQNKILLLFDNLLLCKELAEKAYNNAIEYSWEKHITGLVSIISSLK